MNPVLSLGFSQSFTGEKQGRKTLVGGFSARNGKYITDAPL